MNYDFVVWSDTESGDAYQVEALSYEGDANNIASPPINAGDFVVIYDDKQEHEWFGQIIEPQRNLPLQGLRRDNPSNIAAMERVLEGTVEASVFLRQVYYYRIRLFGEINRSTQSLQSVGRRPRAGSCGRRADMNEVILFMDLPAIKYLDESQEGWYNNILGRIRGVDIPVPIDDIRLYQHVLVAGATGAGKSNTVANLVKAAQTYGMCVIVFDHKPDYQNAHEHNDEVKPFGKYKNLGLERFGLDNVKYFSLYDPTDDQKYNETEMPISILASNMPKNMLAAAMFYRQGEELQQEAFTLLIQELADQQKHGWTLKQFLTWFHTLRTKQPTKLLNVFGGAAPYESTLNAIQYKLSQRKPKWMDALGQDSRATGRGGLVESATKPTSVLTDYFNPMKYLQPGHVIVIRTNVEGREYGLFLSYMLNEVYNLRRRGSLSSPVVNIIDEAQDIFQGSRAVRESATFAVNEIVRKGRSKQVGFVFAAQSASQLPGSILNNLNSRIIHRQNTEDELRSAMPNAPRELLRSALSFGAGEALVSILGARGVVPAEMAPSPFKLTKEQPVDYQTMADQMNQQTDFDDSFPEEDIPF